MKNNKAPMRGKDIRKGNEKLVLRLIQKEGLLSQSEVVEITGLKAPTILRIFTNLVEENLILISKIPKETAEKKGRKPVYYRLNPDALYVVGVEFWSLSATVVISNFVREPIYSNSAEIGKELDGEDVLQIVQKLIEDSIKKMKINIDRIEGIGIGAPGKVDIHEGSIIYYSRIKGLKNFPIRGFLEKKLDVPIFVHNNCSVIAMNEYTDGYAEGADNVMAVFIRGGVGGACINNGKIITSGNVTTMEIGHMSVEPDGRECSCGSKGCLETYLSEEIILNDLSSDRKIENIAELDSILAGGESVNPDFPWDILYKKAEILSYALRNLEHLFSPDLFLIISRSLELSNYLSDKVSKILEGVDNCSEGHKFWVKPVCYDPLHAGMGACDLVFQSYFSGTF